MNSNAEQFVVEVEHLIDNDNLPDPLNDIFGLLDLKELVGRVYEEVLEQTEIPPDANEEQQADLIRELVEQVAMKVGAIAALARNTTPNAVELGVNGAEAIQVFAALMQDNEVTIKLIKE